MKNLTIALFILSLIIPSSCKKEEESKPISKKYAKYRVPVRKDKELKDWLATLEKAEDVDLLKEEDHKNKKGKVLKLANVKLADDSIGYIESRHLADYPIVFTENTKALVRPTAGSKTFIIVPKGALGFVTAEKGPWAQIYIGKIKGKNVTRQWVDGGYIKDKYLVLKAKEYEAAIIALKDKSEEKRIEAKKTLSEIADGTSIIADLAKEKLMELGKTSAEENVEETPAESPVTE